MDGDLETKPGASSDEKRLVNMAEVQVCTTELAYVTGIDEEAATFFAQLCKFTNQELLQHNLKIHEHCKAQISQRETQAPKLIKPKPGDVLCARYAVDGAWYRVVVKRCDEQNRECRVYFADYGNIETVSYNDLVEVRPDQLATIERAPFGFYCKLKNSERFPDKGKMLKALNQEYIMMKPLERLDSNLWRVLLPNVAYNQAFVNSMQQTIKETSTNK